ncbi:MAG TPA: SAM-dependent methyltransferase [Pseudonocardia sp.]|uniref:SAM-dependent methyltransferase n=1 Tax=Pseudonocardia sp. TaxID=60912 RepID=UPI002F3F8F13
MGDGWHQQPAGRPALPENYFQKPSPARMWNYLQGGKDNYPLDRSAGDAMAAAQPDSFYLARQARRFLSRAVRSVAVEAGVRQFLDLGCGLPAPRGLDNVHEVAQSAHPDARVVYVDNDRVVLAHAEALLTPLTPAGRCAYIEADVHDVRPILVRAGETLDFTRPIGVIMIGILGHVADFDEALGLVDEVMGAASAGSCLVVGDGVDDDSAMRQGIARRNESGIAPYHLRTVEQFQSYFRGLELLRPGIVPVTLWRPEPTEVGAARPVPSSAGVARKAA